MQFKEKVFLVLLLRDGPIQHGLSNFLNHLWELGYETVDSGWLNGEGVKTDQSEILSFLLNQNSNTTLYYMDGIHHADQGGAL